MKLIFIFRDPVLRAYSHWNMEVQRGKENRSFSEAIRNQQSDGIGLEEGQHRVFSYVDRGFYCRQMKEVYRLFPKAQVLCLKQEELQDSPTVTLAKVAKHIGLSEFKQIEDKRVHSRTYDAEIAPTDSDYLQNLYAKDLTMFGDLTGLDVSDWLRLGRRADYDCQKSEANKISFDNDY